MGLRVRVRGDKQCSCSTLVMECDRLGICELKLRSERRNSSFIVSFVNGCFILAVKTTNLVKITVPVINQETHDIGRRANHQ